MKPMRWLFLCWLLNSTLSAWAVTDLFKADFENCPSVPGDPVARIGSIDTGSNFTVLASGGGFSNVCMRFVAPGGFVGQGWEFAQHPRTGVLTIQWDMNIVHSPTGSGFILTALYFDTPTNYMYRPAISVFYRTNGVIALESKRSELLYASNTIHQYRLEHDLFTGEGALWMDGHLAAQYESSYRTQYRFAHVILSTHSSYRGTIWLANIQASYSQPYVPSLWAGFDYMTNGPLVSGEIPGYPVHDSVTNVLVDGVAFVTNAPSSAYDKALCVVATNFALDLLPNRPFCDGEYLFQCGLKRMTTNSSVSFALERLGQPIAAAYFAGTNLFAYSNTTLKAVSPAPAGSSYEYDVTLNIDTHGSLYSMNVDGVPVVTNWPLFQTGIPTGLRIQITDPTASTNYIDDVGLAMRGRGSIYVLNTTAEECALLFYDPADRRLSKTGLISTGMPDWVYLSDIDFGAQGYLYGTDYDGASIRVYDPLTLTQVGSCSTALDAPRKMVCFKDGRMAVLDGTNIVCFTGGPNPSYTTTLVHFVSSDFIHFCASHDEKTLLAGTSHMVVEYDAQNGQFLGEVTAVSGIPGLLITDMATASDGRLYVLDRSRTNLLYFNWAGDYYEGSISGVEELHDPVRLGILNNGNLLVADQADSLLHEFDAYTGVALGTYDSGDYYLTGVFAILEPPPFEMVRCIHSAYTNFTFEFEGDPGRYYCIGQSSNLLGNWTLLSPDILATNGRPQISYTNNPASDVRFLGVFESGL
jgi:hypothetical protein